jgi:hypothetical protein
MEPDSAMAHLKRRLRYEVAYFYRRDHRLWKRPVVEMLRELKDVSPNAVLFGGTLRSLLVSRLFARRPGRPRDVDIVIAGSSIDGLREVFRSRIARETRFGGLQLRHLHWQFDIWPLNKTWALVNDGVQQPGFATLPETTFFNLEAVAVDVWPRPGQPREIYSGNEQFFRGILTRTLEINREHNPYPTLCVVRALVLAAAIDFRLGPRLAAYISRNGQNLTAAEIDDVQDSHYGARRWDSATLLQWITTICESYSRAPTEPVQLSLPRQLERQPQVSSR